MAFNIPNQTTYTQPRPTFNTSGWTRPATWISITDTPGEVQYLLSDISNSVFAIDTTFNRPASQNLYIDWGDGVIDTITTNTLTSTQHIYTTGGTPSGLGYNTFKCRVYVDAGATITSSNQRMPTPFAAYQNAFSNANPGVLEEYFGDNTSLIISPLFRIRQPFLQYSKLPSVYTGTSFNNFYTSNLNLQVVVLPTSAPGITDLTQMFLNCENIQSITFPTDMINVGNSMDSVFQNCFSLRTIKLPTSLPLVSSMANTFNGCRSLEDIDFLPETPLCHSYASCFTNCIGLRTAKIKKFPPVLTLSSALVMTAMFNGCVSLENCILPNIQFSGSGNCQINNLFNACSNLKSFVFPSGMTFTQCNNTFQGCRSLQSIVMPTNLPELAQMNNTFQDCSSIASITLPETIGTAISMTSCFQSCLALSEVIYPIGFDNKINNLNSTFQNSNALKKVVLPPTTICPFFNSTFTNCNSLVELTMPTTNNFAAGISFQTTFQSCINLKEITLPSCNSSSITFTQPFRQCSVLSKISFAGSFSTINGALSLTMDSCPLLESFSFPSTSGVITQFNQIFQNNSTMRSIALPTTSATTLTSFSFMFNGCLGLTGITNTHSIGSSSTTGTILSAQDAFVNCISLASLSLVCRLSKFVLSSANTTLIKLSSLRLRNSGTGQYTGTSPQIDIQYTSLGQAALVQLFNDLPVVTGRVCNITGSAGAAALTPAERAIATGKGWTITG
jgi:hypothetical protein